VPSRRLGVLTLKEELALAHSIRLERMEMELLKIKRRLDKLEKEET